MNRKLRIGHTAITWPNEQIETAVAEIASCGYSGTETFGWVLEQWHAGNNDLADVFERHQLQLTSLYAHLDVVNPAVRSDEIAKVLAWTDLYGKFNGPVVIIGSKMFNRHSFSIAEHLPDIVATLNELAEKITDRGLLCCFHPHTGTAVETEEEIRRVMDAVDTSHVSFAPDIGQIAKGGSDPLAIVRDYHEMIRIVHVKDYIGGPIEYDGEGREIDKTGFLGYTPLGQGAVDIAGILRYLDQIGYNGYAHVELDGNHFSPTRKGRPPMCPLEAANTSKRYLEQLGYSL